MPRMLLISMLRRPVPFNVRQTLKGTVMVNDEGRKFYVPPKTRSVSYFPCFLHFSNLSYRVTFSIVHMHRNESYWGPDSNTWDPDRFLDERAKTYIQPNPFIFLPFNAGPRIVSFPNHLQHKLNLTIVVPVSWPTIRIPRSIFLPRTSPLQP